MSENKDPAFNLVPEIALLAPLPDHMRKRFEQALLLMHEQLEEGLTWQQIAKKSAISAFHFHRQFSKLFNETPGRYLSRVRLQYAVYYLLYHNTLSVTDIAQLCGFASSQALAKALKRDLGLTAKAVRLMAQQATPAQTTVLMNKLAHPGESGSLEKQLAEALPCTRAFFDTRFFKRISTETTDWDQILDHYGEKSVGLLGITPTTELEKSWSDIHTQIGKVVGRSENYELEVAAGHYFCCRAYLLSDVAYSQVLHTLFEKAQLAGYEVDPEGHFIEWIEEVDMEQYGGITMQFQIPILS
ncbi:AraC family transcriptional regulator [Pseudoalteromonas rubra]|uniref:AraC family transcriptional regulator n=1 Tax=Pseudoalteromonas rubra TaxID=43658 RepID=A0A5S3WKL8_9GAMM|nr:AraC family transcriptional regulator [Pseudoalteromonas rubra]TMP28167.1 AraC family transcriptional regulator [Pseudoalteromonas rubra]TMP34868.1 AraC family transcriptional regulator [Pseudoalteromonas rubra]